MNEGDFTEQVKRALKARLGPQYMVAKKGEKGANLRYGLIFGPDGTLQPLSHNGPQKALDGLRGFYSFQADVVIHDMKVPLVALELK